MAGGQGGPALGGQAFAAAGVDGVWIDVEHVSPSPGGEHTGLRPRPAGGLEDPPQLGQVGVERGPRPGRGPFPPQGVDEPIQADHPAGVGDDFIGLRDEKRTKPPAGVIKEIGGQSRRQCSSATRFWERIVPKTGTIGFQKKFGFAAL